jgi:hypothetical protein
MDKRLNMTITDILNRGIYFAKKTSTTAISVYTSIASITLITIITVIIILAVIIFVIIYENKSKRKVTEDGNVSSNTRMNFSEYPYSSYSDYQSSQSVSVLSHPRSNLQQNSQSKPLACPRFQPYQLKSHLNKSPAPSNNSSTSGYYEDSAF